jgi:glutamate synthase domain-containing protein 2
MNNMENKNNEIKNNEIENEEIDLESVLWEDEDEKNEDYENLELLKELEEIEQELDKEFDKEMVQETNQDVTNENLTTTKIEETKEETKTEDKIDFKETNSANKNMDRQALINSYFNLNQNYINELRDKIIKKYLNLDSTVKSKEEIRKDIMTFSQLTDLPIIENTDLIDVVKEQRLISYSDISELSPEITNNIESVTDISNIMNLLDTLSICKFSCKIDPVFSLKLTHL